MQANHRMLLDHVRSINEGVVAIRMKFNVPVEF